jgi:hypothetical protein
VDGDQREAVVVKQRLDFLREELAMGERLPPWRGAVDGGELHRHEEHLRGGVVVEALGVAHQLATGRITKPRRAVGTLGVAREVFRMGHGDIHHEMAAWREQGPHAGEERLDIDPLVQVEEGVERRDDQRERLRRRAQHRLELSHIAVVGVDPRAHFGRLLREPTGELLEHRRGEVDPGDVGASASERERDAAMTDADLQHAVRSVRRALLRSGAARIWTRVATPHERFVEHDVFVARGVGLLVVPDVVVVNGRAPLEGLRGEGATEAGLFGCGQRRSGGGYGKP